MKIIGQSWCLSLLCSVLGYLLGVETFRLAEYFGFQWLPDFLPFVALIYTFLRVEWSGSDTSSGVVASGDRPIVGSGTVGK